MVLGLPIVKHIRVSKLLYSHNSGVENEKGLCAYIIYMHIVPFHSQPLIVVMLYFLLTMLVLYSGWCNTSISR